MRRYIWVVRLNTFQRQLNIGITWHCSSRERFCVIQNPCNSFIMFAGFITFIWKVSFKQSKPKISTICVSWLSIYHQKPKLWNLWSMNYSCCNLTYLNFCQAKNLNLPNDLSCSFTLFITVQLKTFLFAWEYWRFPILRRTSFHLSKFGRLLNATQYFSFILDHAPSYIESLLQLEMCHWSFSPVHLYSNTISFHPKLVLTLQSYGVNNDKLWVGRSVHIANYMVMTYTQQVVRSPQDIYVIVRSQQ